MMSDADSEYIQSVSESLSEFEIIVMTPTYSSPALTQTNRGKYFVTSLTLGFVWKENREFLGRF